MTHERLRLAREGKGWSVDDLAKRTGISLRTVELIEGGHFAELPAGLYCRASIRNYAIAVGLDADVVLESVKELLPVPEDPLDGLARRHGHARKVDPKPAEPACSDAVDQFRPTAAAERDAPAPSHASIVPEQVVSAPSRRWLRALAASAIDGALLMSMGAVLAWLTATACGTTVAGAFRVASPGMAVVFALIVALYFVLFGGVGNATLGVSLMRLGDHPSGRIVLNPSDVLGRARRSIFHDSSLLVE